MAIRKRLAPDSKDALTGQEGVNNVLRRFMAQVFPRRRLFPNQQAHARAVPFRDSGGAVLLEGASEGRADISPAFPPV